MKQRRNERGRATPSRAPKRADRSNAAANRHTRWRVWPLRDAVAVALVITALATIVVVLNVMPAWHQTELREAYIPDLAAQSIDEPNDGRLMALLGGRLAESGDHSSAISVLSHALECGEDAPVVWETFAGEAAMSGNRALAQTVLTKGETITSGSPDLAAALNRLQSVPASVSPSEVAMAVDPGGPDALLSQYASGSYLNGVAEWWGRSHPDQSGFATRQEWAEESPSDPTALRYWGMALDENSRSAEAVQVLQSAQALSPNDPQVLVALAEALQHSGKSDLASDEYIRALQLNPNLVEGLVGLGAEQLQMGNTTLARVCFKHALALSPQSADAWIGLGRSDISNNDLIDESDHAFETASRIDPSRTDFIDDWALALIAANQYPRAESMLDAYLVSHEDDAAAQVELGRAILLNDPNPSHLAQSKEHTQAALNSDPNNALALSQMGGILLREHNAATAVPELEHAWTEQPQNVTTMRLLARAYEANGQSARAVRMAASAQSMDSLILKRSAILGEESQRYLDVGYHRQLLAIFEKLGETSDADGELSIIQQLTTDPTGAAAKRKSYDDALMQALGPDAITAQTPTASP
jgi:tetratricopeptide (TPR) repeat protein